MQHVDFANTPASANRPSYPYHMAGQQLPLVSIITPFFNAAANFTETLVALQRMSFAAWEWLVIDDGSTNHESVALLAEVASQEPRLRAIHQENAGPGAARNRGAIEARGRYLFQIDNDDLVEPTFIEQAVWFLETHPQFAFCGAWVVRFEDDQAIWNYGFEKYEAFVDENWATCMAIIRREAHLAIGGYDQHFRHGHEDWDYWLSMADAGYWGYTLPSPLLWYRIQAASRISQTEGDRQRLASFLHTLHEKHAGVRERFPMLGWAHNLTLPDKVSLYPPVSNPLVKPEDTKRLLYLAVGQPTREKVFLQRLSHMGYQLTVVATTAAGQTVLDMSSTTTPDCFRLDSFLDTWDYPRFLGYLIGSRAIDGIVITGGAIAPAIVNYFTAAFPQVALIDEILAETNDIHERIDGQIRQALASPLGKASAEQMHHLGRELATAMRDEARLARRAEAARVATPLRLAREIRQALWPIGTPRYGTYKRRRRFIERVYRASRNLPNKLVRRLRRR